MEPSEALLVIGRDSRVYDTLHESQVGRDFRLFFCDIDAFLRENSVRVVVLDAEETAADIGLLLRMKQSDPLLDLIVASPSGRSEEMLAWIDRGAADVLTKPLDSSAAAAALRKLA
jgi:DNA-binding NtrC family response regulator